MSTTHPMRPNRKLLASHTLAIAVAALLLGTSGCGSCRGLFGRKSPPVPPPVYSQCAPLCTPSCNSCDNPCDACDNGGNQISYGYGSVPPTTMTVPTTGETLPIMVPAGSGSNYAP